MRTACGWSPHQQVKYPLVVWWSEDSEHYLAECQECEWESPITWNRFQARRWALAHQCNKALHA